MRLIPFKMGSFLPHYVWRIDAQKTGHRWDKRVWISHRCLGQLWQSLTKGWVLLKDPNGGSLGIVPGLLQPK